MEEAQLFSSDVNIYRGDKGGDSPLCMESVEFVHPPSTRPGDGSGASTYIYVYKEKTVLLL